MKYYKCLGSFMKERCPQIDNEGIDLLEGLLAYNPKHRLSAKSALAHPWFRTSPYPCQPFQIQKMDKEYHDYMHRAEKTERLRKEKIERVMQEKREVERNNLKWGTDDKKSEKKDGISRLKSLLGGSYNTGTNSTKKDVAHHKDSRDLTKDDRDQSKDRAKEASKAEVIDEDRHDREPENLTKRKPEPNDDKNTN